MRQKLIATSFFRLQLIRRHPLSQKSIDPKMELATPSRPSKPSYVVPVADFHHLVEILHPVDLLADRLASSLAALFAYITVADPVAASDTAIVDLQLPAGADRAVRALDLGLPIGSHPPHLKSLLSRIRTALSALERIGRERRSTS
jgi:hypothetical protein